MHTFRNPGWLVLIAIAASILACSIDISTAHFADPIVSRDPQGEERARAYAPGETFYCVVTLKNAPDDTRAKAVWRAVEVAGQAPDTIIGETEVTSGAGTITFEAAPPEEGWPRGNYRVELYLNGRKTDTIPFQVG